MRRATLLAIAGTGFLGSALGLITGFGGLWWMSDARTPTTPRVVEGFAQGVAVDAAPAAKRGRLALDQGWEARLHSLEQAHRDLAASLHRMENALEALESAAPESAAPAGATAATGAPSEAELEGLVMRMIERERTARAEERARLEEARVAEAAALNDGPYGAYNYRVNRVSRALALTPDQELAYHDLLAEYSQASATLTEQLQQEMVWDGVPGEEMQHRVHELLTRTAAIEAEMQREFALLLDDRQRRSLEELPPDLRQIAGPVVIADSDFRAVPSETR